MRIIAGSARGTKLETLPGENTRPTSERAKEAVFSMLQFELRERRVLDLFAGSGQMGLEAISRGAAHAVFVDASRDAVQVIRKNVERVRFVEECEVVCADYADYLTRLRRSDQTFDLVILDPPYQKGLLQPALHALLQGGCLSERALLVCETGSEDVFDGDGELAHAFTVCKQARYGVAHVTLLELASIPKE